MKDMGATSTNIVQESGFKVFVIVLMVLCQPGIWFSLGLVQAASPITPSGLNTEVSQAVTLPTGQTQYNITGGTRPGGVSGTNLYHSFGDFNVPNNNIANFLNDSGLATSNILGRVTGGNPSTIFGTIQTTGFENANLFLMNPTGFLFGPNATVNVGGMVAFTSADYLRLANGVLFNAIPNATADALLSAAPVAAFGFLGSNPGAITVQGSQFSVSDRTGISLIGGNITIQNGTLESGAVQPARLSAPNGQINIATAKSPGEFLQDLTTAPTVNDASFTSFGSLHLGPGSTVDVSQTGNGKVSIRGGQLALEIQNASLRTAGTAAPSVARPGQDSIVLSGGSSITSVTTSADPGLDVQIVADYLQFVGTPPDFSLETPPNPVNIITTTLGSGGAGNINVTSNQDMDLSTVTVASSSPFSPAVTGNAGNINLTSTNGNISMTNGVFVTSEALGAAGKAGTITVNAPHGDILMQLALLINSIGNSGNGGGGIQVTANNLTMGTFSSMQIDNFNLPVPGAITVHLSGNLSLDGLARIQTVARGPALAAADLNITADDVSISGGSLLNTETQSSGPGGHMNIFANNLQLTTGGQILSGSNLGEDSSTFPSTPVIPSGAGGTINIQGLAGPAASVLIDGAGSGIFTNTVGTGTAGNTSITAQSVTIQNGGTISAATSGIALSATGGSITISAGQFALNSGGLITAASTGPGAGGAIMLDVGSTFASNAGTVSSTATQAQGGDITITAGQSATLNNGSSISASTRGAGNAGNIIIDAGQTFLASNSKVTTEANQASGGSIKITTNPSGTVEFTNSMISASVLNGTGGGGSVNIDPQYVLLQNSQILARAFEGPGGNITINITNGGLFLPDANSTISASSQFGVNGTVTIQNPNAPAGGQIQPLGRSPLLATSLLNQRCAALAGGEFSSFTVAGRDSLPTEPGSWLTSPLALGLAGTGDGTLPEKGVRAGIDDDPAHETTILSLRQIVPAGFLTQAFAVNSSAGCQS